MLLIPIPFNAVLDPDPVFRIKKLNKFFLD